MPTFLYVFMGGNPKGVLPEAPPLSGFGFHQEMQPDGNYLSEETTLLLPSCR